MSILRSRVPPPRSLARPPERYQWPPWSANGLLRGAPHGSGLGRTRRVVERSIAWLHQFKRPRIRCGIRAGLHQGNGRSFASFTASTRRPADSSSTPRPETRTPKSAGPPRSSDEPHPEHRSDQLSQTAEGIAAVPGIPGPAGIRCGFVTRGIGQRAREGDGSPSWSADERLGPHGPGRTQQRVGRGESLHRGGGRGAV